MIFSVQIALYGFFFVIGLCVCYFGIGCFGLGRIGSFGFGRIMFLLKKKSRFGETGVVHHSQEDYRSPYRKKLPEPSTRTNSFAGTRGGGGGGGGGRVPYIHSHIHTYLHTYMHTYRQIIRMYIYIFICLPIYTYVTIFQVLFPLPVLLQSESAPR